MTKADLELENKFLKLQLKVINDLVKDTAEINENELFEKLGAIQYYSDKEIIIENLKFIKENKLDYNFYNKLERIEY